MVSRCLFKWFQRVPLHPGLNEYARLKQQNAELQTAAEKSEALLASTRGALSAAETALAEERTARRRLEGRTAYSHPAPFRSRLKASIEGGNTCCSLVVNGLKQTESRRVYKLWWVVNGRTVLEGELRAAVEGAAALETKYEVRGGLGV